MVYRVVRWGTCRSPADLLCRIQCGSQELWSLTSSHWGTSSRHLSRHPLNKSLGCHGTPVCLVVRVCRAHACLWQAVYIPSNSDTVQRDGRQTLHRSYSWQNHVYLARQLGTTGVGQGQGSPSNSSGQTGGSRSLETLPPMIWAMYAWPVFVSSRADGALFASWSVHPWWLMGWCGGEDMERPCHFAREDESCVIYTYILYIYCIYVERMVKLKVSWLEVEIILLFWVW